MLAGSAFAATPKPSRRFITFICNGTRFQRTGAVSRTAAGPVHITLGSDGNFYGAAQDVYRKEAQRPTAERYFRSPRPGPSLCCTLSRPGTNKTYPNGNLPGLCWHAGIRWQDLRHHSVWRESGGCNGYCGYRRVIPRQARTGIRFSGAPQVLLPVGLHGRRFGGRVVPGIDGNLYGASFVGRTPLTAALSTRSCGTIFRVTPSTGAYEVVFNFPGSTSDEFPSSFIALRPTAHSTGLTQGHSGQNRYSTTLAATGIVNQSVALNFPSAQWSAVSSVESLASRSERQLSTACTTVYGESGEGLFEVGTWTAAIFNSFRSITTRQRRR